MNKEDKAKEYADWLHKNVEEFYGRWCDPKDMYYKNGDIRMAFEAGWDACLEQIKQVMNYQSELRDKSESMPADFAELLNEHFSELI